MNSFSQNTSDQEQAIRSFLRDYSNKSDNGQTIQEYFPIYAVIMTQVFIIMLSLINEVLDMSKIESGKVDLV
ncbi:MAG: hypothetical protein ACI4Q6_06900, partial [Huintestinicola sp.]